MRAIAVTLVVLYHGFPDTFTGGYIGVDVFFVISGFLITKLIFQELESNTFNFKNFYTRRIRRIFPALIIVLYCTFFLGYATMTAEELKNLTGHVKSAVTFLSNFQLRKEIGYFENSAEFKPLLHLWSLAIEEQFYILWPTILYVAFRLESTFHKLILALIILSFAANLSVVNHNPSKAFFYPHTRFWELMVGGIIAWGEVFSSKVQPKELPRIFYNLFFCLAIASLLSATFALKRSVDYPGWWALIPVISTMTLILTGTKSTFSNRVFENRYIIVLGLISYPLYLWHWPILAFLRLLSPKPSFTLIAASLTVAIILAFATWKLVEIPCRQLTKPRFILPILALPLLALFALGDFTERKEGFKGRTHVADLELEIESIKEPKETRVSDGSCQQFNKLKLPTGVQCLTNSPFPDTLIVGDSHALALNSAAHLGMVDLKTLAIAVHGCSPLYGYQLLSRNSGTTAPTEIQGCAELIPTIETALSIVPSIKKVIISTRGDDFYVSFHGAGSDYEIKSFTASTESPQQMYISGYMNFIRALKVPTKQITFFLGTPPLNGNPANCLGTRPLSFNLQKRPYCETPLKTILENREFNLHLSKKIKEEFRDIKIFDPIDIFCNENTCFGFRNKKMLYFDSTHMSIQASKIALNQILLD